LVRAQDGFVPNAFTFLFVDRGEFVAKGFEEPVRVYEVSWGHRTASSYANGDARAFARAPPVAA
jgi:hypothetical protein